MTNEQALKVLLDAGAKLLRFRRKPDPEAPRVEAKNPKGFGDWSRISAGGPGATLDECVEWLTSGTARVVRNGEIVTLRLGDGERAGIGLLPASIGKLVVDIDLTMPGREWGLRSLAGHGAVRRAIGKPDGVQSSPSGGPHFYYPDAGIPEDFTRTATWAVDDAKVGKVGGDIRGSNGWVGVYDLQALARMVQAGHGPALDVAKLRAFANNPHREAGKRRGEAEKLTREAEKLTREAEKLTREKQVLEGRKRDQDRRALHLARWERANTKEQDSLVWKTILVCGVALVFVVVFNNARERAEFRAACIEDTVRFGAWEYRISGLSLREWCRKQYAEALSADDDYYYR